MSVVFGDGFAGSNIDKNVQVVLGGAVALQCMVPDANPPPEILWFNSAGQMVELVDDQVILEENGRYLILVTLTAEILEDSYRCRVINVRLTETVISSTQYSLVDDLPSGEQLVYKEIGNLTGRSGDTLNFIYVAGYRPTGSGFIRIIISCRLGDEDMDDNLPNTGLIVTVPVPKPIGSKNKLAITCDVVTSDGPIEQAEGSLTIVGK